MARGTHAGLRIPAAGSVLIATHDAAEQATHLDGRLEDPAILAGWFDGVDDPLARPRHAGSGPGGVGFSQGIGGSTITDAGPQGCHGVTVKLPARGMVGARWTGQEDRVPQRGVGLVFLGRAGYRGQAAKAGMLTVRSSLNGAMVSRVM